MKESILRRLSIILLILSAAFLFSCSSGERAHNMFFKEEIELPDNFIPKSVIVLDEGFELYGFIRDDMRVALYGDDLSLISIGETDNVHLENENERFIKGSGPDDFCDYLTSGINTYYVGNCIVTDGDDVFYAVCYDRVFRMTRIPDELTPRREILRVRGQFSPILGDAIVAFNESNERYRVVLEDTDSEDAAPLDYDDPPDIIICSEEESEELINNLPLCDLYDFIDSDDTVARGSFYRSLLKNSEIDGKLPALPAHFKPYGLLAAKSAGLPERFTADEFLEKMKASDDETIGTMGQEELLRALIFAAGIPAGGFDTPEFREILEAAKNEKICARITWSSIINILQLETNRYLENAYRETPEGDSGLRMYGLPADGESSGIILSPSDFCAIPDGAKNKRAAWEFLKIFLDTVPEYRFEHHDYYWMYINLIIGTRTGFTLRSASERNFTDNESLFCFWHNDNGIMCEIQADEETAAKNNLGKSAPIPESAFRRYAKMIEDAGKPMPDKQWQTIKEICAGYFDGTVSLDETIIRLTLSSAAR